PRRQCSSPLFSWFETASAAAGRPFPDDDHTRPAGKALIVGVSRKPGETDDEDWDGPGLVDTLSLSPEVLPMPRTRPPYSPEFRRQMVDLVRAGRNPDDLAGEFEPSGHSIRAWVAQADRHEGRREEAAPGLSAFERDELTR